MIDHTHNELYQRIVELYAAVVWLARFVCALCGLVILQMIAKYVIYARIRLTLDRVDQLLHLMEMHGGITDAKAQELKTAQAQAVKTVAGVVKMESQKIRTEVPVAVAKAVAIDVANRESEQSGDSGLRSVK